MQEMYFIIPLIEECQQSIHFFFAVVRLQFWNLTRGSR